MKFETFQNHHKFSNNNSTHKIGFVWVFWFMEKTMCIGTIVLSWSLEIQVKSSCIHSE